MPLRPHFSSKSSMTHRRSGLDAVAQTGGHMDPGAQLRFQRVVAQGQLRLALEEVQHGGHRGGVFG